MDSCHTSLRIKSQEIYGDIDMKQARREVHQELQRKVWRGIIRTGFPLLPVDVGQGLRLAAKELCDEGLQE